MSAIFAGAGDGVTQANNVPAGDDYACMCWYKRTASFAPTGYQTIFARINAAYDGFAGVWAYNDGSIFFFGLDAHNTVTGTSLQTVTNIELDQWYHVAYTKRGSTHRLYINGVLIGNFVLNISGLTFTDLTSGYDGFSDPGFEIQGFREWNDVLSPSVGADQSAIISEMNSEINSFANPSALVTNTPLVSDLLDISGNGNDWSAVGSVTFGAQPPFLANSIAANAIDISAVPDTIVQDLFNGGIVWDAWYKYTAGSDEQLGLWGFGNLTDFAPFVSVWSPDGVTPYVSANTQIEAQNVPIQLPIKSGETYYFRFRTNDQSLLVAEITINLLFHNPVGIVRGAICINDDSELLPLAVMSPDVDHLVYQFVQPFACGEAGDILDNGVILATEKQTQEFIGYDANYQEIFRSAGGVVVLLANGTIRQCRGTQRFWIALFVTPNVTVRYVEDDGTLGTAHVLGTLSSTQPDAIAANNDESILYFSVRTGANVGKIISYNLATDTIIGDFAAAISGYRIADILVLSDDTIVAVYTNTSTRDVKVLRYNAAGTILNTYEFGTDHNFPNGALVRIAYSLDDPNSFWIYEQLLSEVGISKFSEIAVSDGSVIRSVFHTIYEEGAYTGAANDDPVRFGHSFSCPFWVATQGIEPPGGGTLTVIKICISEPETEFNVSVGGGLIPSEIQLANGDSQLYDPVMPGSYSVVEEPIAKFFTTYQISNDPTGDNLNIQVGEGENVVVTIINQLRSRFSGIYRIVPNSGTPVDTYIDQEGRPTRLAIPDPFFITGGIKDH